MARGSEPFRVRPDSNNDFNTSLFDGSANDFFNFRDGTFLGPSGSSRHTGTDIVSNNPETTPICTSQSPPVSMMSQTTTAVETEDPSPDDAVPADHANAEAQPTDNSAPTLQQSMSLYRAIADNALDWFLIRIGAISLFTNYLCTTDCSPGSQTATIVLRSINQAIQSIRRVQPSPAGWMPEKVSIRLEDGLCQTSMSNSIFRKAFKAEISIAREELLQMAYDSTRKLLVPSHQQLDQFEYPRIVLLRSLNDSQTASNWSTPDGNLLWDDRHGYQLFHLDIFGNDGRPTIIWFGRLEIREFLSHFFHQSRSIGFIEVYERVRSDLGVDQWVEISHATDPMLAFGLAWIVAVVDADVLRNKQFTSTLRVTKRRCEHFLKIYSKIIAWFRTLRDPGVPIPGLSPESRMQALQAIGNISDLSLPDLTNYLHHQIV